MARKQLYINGVGTGDYGIYISSDTYLNAPAPDITAHSVPGRNGDLIQWNKRLNNIVRKFTCYIPSDAQSNFDEFKKLLYLQDGYMEISSDYETDTYQRGYLADEIEAEPFQKDENLSVTFEIYFSCEPQKYIKNVYSLNSDVSSGTTMRSAILPRSHQLVQAIFKAIPSDAVPDGDFFIYFQGNQYLMGTDIGATFDTFNFNLNATEANKKFVACAYINFVEDEKFAVFRKLLGYSNYGDLNNAQLDLTIVDNIGFLFEIVPYAQWRFTGQTSAGNSWDSGWQIISGRDFMRSSTAVGIHYKVTITGTYGIKDTSGTSTAWDIDDKGYTVVIRGYNNTISKGVFLGGFVIDASIFRSMMPDESQIYDYSITIDTETMQAEGVFNGVSVKMNNYVNIIGNIEGLADSVTIWVYHQAYSGTNHSRDTLWFDEITIEPRWWKI